MVETVDSIEIDYLQSQRRSDSFKIQERTGSFKISAITQLETVDNTQPFKALLHVLRVMLS